MDVHLQLGFYPYHTQLTKKAVNVSLSISFITCSFKNIYKNKKNQTSDLPFSKPFYNVKSPPSNRYPILGARTTHFIWFTDNLQAWETKKSEKKSASFLRLCQSHPLSSPCVVNKSAVFSFRSCVTRTVRTDPKVAVRTRSGRRVLCMRARRNGIVNSQILTQITEVKKRLKELEI